ncbi:sigma-70 family RNA polymerase sigma factor [Halobacillus karajensis]|uniref:sigma-70 family RNA polymerase sigma factor n=1 Tax=Halobacillus karajensis TaxID=195088 RepID=UPI00045C5141|nr:sigma-70 family RNA polymerase sigma factor [Halobacillus karajensis]CDQ17958.1 positive control sigma-like factor [Halobacillus karajensis]
MLIELLYEYKLTRRYTKQLRDQLIQQAKTVKDHEDIEQYNLIISSLNYAIEWLEYGRQPYAKRGLDRRDAYRRLVFMDEEAMSVLGEEINSEESTELSTFDKERIEDALSVLTKKEKDIYLMHKVELLSYERIAELLGVKKGTVQSYVNRAENKMREQVESSLFCVV